MKISGMNPSSKGIEKDVFINALIKGFFSAFYFTVYILEGVYPWHLESMRNCNENINRSYTITFGLLLVKGSIIRHQVKDMIIFGFRYYYLNEYSIKVSG